MHIDYERPSLLMPVALSLVVHAVFLITSLLVPAALPQEPKEMLIEAWPTSPAEVEKMTQNTSTAMRIADIDKPAVQKRPQQARFVGMYDSSVEEETVSPGRGRGGGKASGTGRGAGVGPGTGRRGKGRHTAKQPGRGSARKDKLFRVDDNLFAMREPPKKTRMPSQGGGGKVSIGGGGGDYFPDVKVGEHTYLNVLRYPEVSYFVRLKRAFRMTFNPVPALKSYFSTNQVARGSVEVVMGVSVDGGGRLSELFVLRSSGIPSYDHEAMRTVRASAPFSKPPNKFLASDGVLRMMWTFTVYL